MVTVSGRTRLIRLGFADTDAAERALTAIARFRQLAKDMGLKTVHTVATGWSWPGMAIISTSVMASSFSVLITALFQVSGIAPPV